MIVTKGATDVTTYVMMVDSTTGAPETALTITDLDLQYTRNQSAPAAKVDAVALAATNTAHTDNRAIAVDATSSPGLYRVDWPDAAFASGVDKVVLVVTCTGCHPAVILVELVNYNTQDGVRLGLTALPNAAADAAGGLPISDAGGLDLDAKLANTNEVTAARMGALTDWINGGRLDLLLDAVKAVTDALPDAGALTSLATAANLAAVAGYLDTEIAAILADTNEMQTDWANGGRLDLILDARASQTSVDDVPTNAELATALGTADDAVLTQVALVKAKTDLIPSDPADQSAVEAAILAAWTTALTESYAANGVAFTPAQGLFAIHQFLQEFAITSTSYTVKKLDGSTAFVVTLDDATTPTALVRA